MLLYPVVIFHIHIWFACRFVWASTRPAVIEAEESYENEVLDIELYFKHVFGHGFDSKQTSL